MGKRRTGVKAKAKYVRYEEPRTHLKGDEDGFTFCGKDMARKHYITVDEDPTCERCKKAKAKPESSSEVKDSMVSYEKKNPHPGYVSEPFDDRWAVRMKMPDGTWEFIKEEDGKAKWFGSQSAAETYIAGRK